MAERLASVGTVASGIVHNLRSPLAVIQGYGQLIQMRHPEVVEIEQVRQAGLQMGELIDQVLDRGRRQLKPQMVDVNELLRRELDFLNTNLEFKHRIDKQINLTEGLPSVKAVYSDLSQVFENLLRNAVDAMYGRDTKRLTVTTALERMNVIVTVGDTGCGIPPDKRDRIFDPFFTTKPAEATGDGPVGTGLGLYTVKQILQRYDGRIAVDSTVDQGTQLCVTLPLNPNQGGPP